MKIRYALAFSLTLLTTQTIHGQQDAGLRIAESTPARIPLAGDWNGDGQREIGWFESTTAELFQCATYAPVSVLQSFVKCSSSHLPSRAKGWTPLTLNWNGGPSEELAIYDPESGQVHLLNFTDQGAAKLELLVVGLPGRIPVAGDWNGNGLDSLGFYDPEKMTFAYLENLDDTLYQSFHFGPPCYPDPVLYPIAADRDGDGVDTLGLHINEAGVYLSNQPWTNAVGEEIVLNWNARTIAGPWGDDHLLVYDPASHMVLLTGDGDPASGIPADWPEDPDYLTDGCGGGNDR